MAEHATCSFSFGNFITVTAYKDDNGGDPDRSTHLWTRVEAVNTGAANRVDVFITIPGKAWDFTVKVPTGTTSWNIPPQYRDATGTLGGRTVY